MDKKKRKRSRAAEIARLKAKKQSEPALASNYFHHLSEYIRQHPNLKVVIYCRVSACMQQYNDNPKNHERVLRRKHKKLNFPIIGCYHEVSSGWVLDDRRTAFIEAVQKAKETNAVIVTTSSDRYLRNRDYKTTTPDILPTKDEYEQLKKLTGDVPLLTLLHPDMPPMEVRSYQSKWGQKTKRNKGGRPRKKISGYKKLERVEKLPTVLRLHKKGWKVSKIAFKTGLKQDRIRAWIDKG